MGDKTVQKRRSWIRTETGESGPKDGMIIDQVMGEMANEVTSEVTVCEFFEWKHETCDNVVKVLIMPPRQKKYVVDF